MLSLIKNVSLLYHVYVLEKNISILEIEFYKSIELKDTFHSYSDFKYSVFDKNFKENQNKILVNIFSVEQLLVESNFILKKYIHKSQNAIIRANFTIESFYRLFNEKERELKTKQKYTFSKDFSNGELNELI